MERRRTGGMTRRCHGDLHLGNICLVDGEPTLFDAVEFNDRIACCDLLYDLAFLVMDLWDRGHRRHANRALNRYLWRTGDWDGIALLPLFLSCRAAVRAKTSAWAAAVQEGDGEAGRRRTEAGAYLDLALAALDRPAPGLLALGGLSGTGKTTLALALAPGRGPVPGALLLRSDVLRKQLAGVAFEQQLYRGAYTEASSAEVYDRLGGLAARALDAGLCAIADAVFLKPAEREAIEAVARTAGRSFAGLWLEAPRDTLEDRVETRSGDASDADAAVVELQAALDPGDVAWTRIDTSREAAEVAFRAGQALADAP
jgi:predicted kinase